MYVRHHFHVQHFQRPPEQVNMKCPQKHDFTILNAYPVRIPSNYPPVEP